MNFQRVFTLSFCTPPHAYPLLFDGVVVITGGWCVAKKKGTYRGHHLPRRKKKGKKRGIKKKKKKKGKKKQVPSIELANFDWIV